MQIASPRLQRSPEPLDEDVVQIATAPIHGEFDIGLDQSRDPTCALVLAALIRIHDLGLAIFGDGVVQCYDAKAGAQRVLHIFCPHVGAKLPGHDVAAVIVEDRAEIEPAPVEDFDVGKVCLPELVDPSCLIFKLVRRLKHDEGRAGDQIMRLECAIHSGFRDKIAFLIRE